MSTLLIKQKNVNFPMNRISTSHANMIISFENIKHIFPVRGYLLLFTKCNVYRSLSIWPINKSLEYNYILYWSLLFFNASKQSCWLLSNSSIRDKKYITRFIFQVTIPHSQPKSYIIRNETTKCFFLNTF